MTLFINTASENKITIGLIQRDGDLKYKDELFCQFEYAEKLLPAINQLLKGLRIVLKDLKGIVVVSGPGGFTALRVAVITTNTLGFSLKIPVVGVKLSEFSNLNELAKIGLKRLRKTKKQTLVLPYYGRQPYITKAKKKIWL